MAAQAVGSGGEFRVAAYGLTGGGDRGAGAVRGVEVHEPLYGARGVGDAGVILGAGVIRGAAAARGRRGRGAHEVAVHASGGRPLRPSAVKEEATSVSHSTSSRKSS
ncbi:hypothetical protein GCM10010347_50170 [Streptomyces cirratus]|uniref:Uncharacterized protein n=1 Tax=Streptomyces cirratus TaxID=68187 RepID=A0ABQ3F2I9_9ACTN|nr:hypothetical protein GCM10010347_50170 [Streptomyces cirratus]